MPGAKFMNAGMLKLGLDAGSVTQAAIDDSVRRILRAMFAVGVMDEPLSTWDWKNLAKNVSTKESMESARRLSAMGTVLLKNAAGLLPLPRDKKLAVVGLAGRDAVFHGAGSGAVAPSNIFTPLDGIRAEAGAAAEVRFTDGRNISAAKDLAKWAEYTLVFVGTLSTEGRDRASLSLDDGCEVTLKQCGLKNQNALVQAVAQASNKVIVVASVPGATLLPWSQEVEAILTNFMPGQEAGHAIADVLFGRVNPSAKLPVTFPNNAWDSNLTVAQYPGVPDAQKNTYSYYLEKLYVGYRKYDADNIKFTTGFPFGHGLSYTTFDYSHFALEMLSDRRVKATFVITNTGKRAGQEVAQLYLHFPTAAGEPPWQLKGFQKTSLLAPGRLERVELYLTERDRSIWDPEDHAWSVVHGRFKVSVGSSSRDFRLRGSFGGDQPPHVDVPDDSPFFSQVGLFAAQPGGYIV